MAWVIAPDGINPEYHTALIKSQDWMELDGHQIDYNVSYFEDYANLEVEVYVDEEYAGIARHYDDLPKVIDRYLTEGGDN